MEYMTIGEASELWNISARRIQVLCAGGRIPGAQRFGHAWAIPRNSQKPVDARIKSGKYIKNNSSCCENENIVSRKELGKDE